MSFLKTLKINSVRNIEYAELELSPKLNLIHGKNGSGKTSILESVHLLAMGRSFRTSKTNSLIAEYDSGLGIYGETGANCKIGLSKVNRQKQQLKLDSMLQKNWDSVARNLPVQVIDSNSFLLLEGGPKARRRFLDWGVFHVKQNFVSDWRSTRKCIANRNALLRAGGLDNDQFRAWDIELSQSSEKVDLARAEYFGLFEPVFKEIYKSLAGESPISISYWRGWPDGEPLLEVLSASRDRDQKYGATQSGPHRADIHVRYGNQPAIEILSRGQQKVLVSALKIAQGLVYSRLIGDACIYLLDDLPAELDNENRDKIIAKIFKLECQLFITSIDLDATKDFAESIPKTRTFHVERGKIKA